MNGRIAGCVVTSIILFLDGWLRARKRKAWLAPTPRVQRRVRLSCARGREKFSAHVRRPTRVCVCRRSESGQSSLRSLLGRAQQQNPRIDRQKEWDVSRGWTRFCRPKSPCQVMDALSLRAALPWGGSLGLLSRLVATAVRHRQHSSGWPCHTKLHAPHRTAPLRPIPLPAHWSAHRLERPVCPT
ncbi:uncharacterized protein J3D65DRAFT_19226 [Phyllosticta citribraziliensis]|uniref:Secreted protein n=1 Tax=Phyllosticta citribraziliensis TaxID=989973 RepID=A0ABR1M971_9PEZI